MIKKNINIAVLVWTMLRSNNSQSTGKMPITLWNSRIKNDAFSVVKRESKSQKEECKDICLGERKYEIKGDAES